MFKFGTSTNPPGQKAPSEKRIFGSNAPPSRLVSAFIFPAVQRPKGLNLNAGKKSEKPVSKKP